MDPSPLAEPLMTDYQLSVDVDLNGRVLLEMLSGFLMHERCAAHLYRSARTHHAARRKKFQEFGQETEDHARVYEQLIRRLGGDPRFESAVAKLYEFRGAKLLESLQMAASLDYKTAELAALEALLMAETQCRADWQFLGALAERLPDSQAREALRSAVQQVAAQEEAHLSWAASTWQQATLAFVAAR
jgi:rubrerythrin